MMRKIVVETFESWQGEGFSMGRRCMFIRFGGCSLRCKWCDTKYASDPQNFQQENWLTIEEVKDRLEKAYRNGVRRFIFTGGEPMLYQNEIVDLMDFVDEMFINDIEKVVNSDEPITYPVFEIETNGTIDIDEKFFNALSSHCVYFNISPKPPYSQEKGWEDKVEPILLNRIGELEDEDLVDGFIVKFVVGDERDKEFVKQIQQKYNIPPYKIYIQPNCVCGSCCISKMRELLKWCEENNYNISPRLHLILELK